MSFHEIATAAHITELEDAKEDLQDRVDGLESALTDVEAAADKYHDAIHDAVRDLESLKDVPLRDLAASVDVLIEQLRSVV